MLFFIKILKNKFNFFKNEIFTKIIMFLKKIFFLKK